MEYVYATSVNMFPGFFSVRDDQSFAAVPNWFDQVVSDEGIPPSMITFPEENRIVCPLYAKISMVNMVKATKVASRTFQFCMISDKDRIVGLRYCNSGSYEKQQVADKTESK